MAQRIHRGTHGIFSIIPLYFGPVIFPLTRIKDKAIGQVVSILQRQDPPLQGKAD